MKTVRKALAILNSFTQDVKPLGVTEIAKKLGIHKSSSHALLAALKDEGYVVFDPETRKYYLGFKILELARKISYKRDLRDLSLPIMQELSKRCDEDVALNILVEGKRVCISLVESRYFVRQFVPLGKALPLHCSAAGKVLMAYLSQKEIEAIIKNYGLPAFTPNTITEKDRLIKELKKVKEKGYGESREEYGKDAAALAFPIFDSKGKVVASLSIQSTVNRLTNSS
ncbi:MAG: IclR family transcriptional regulator, partial [Deltaproteobacteria bacterium]|nr:IclR family transcriptional regulator [Deltaproteobacteria bacterium]